MSFLCQHGNWQWIKYINIVQNHSWRSKYDFILENFCLLELFIQVGLEKLLMMVIDDKQHT